MEKLFVQILESMKLQLTKEADNVVFVKCYDETDFSKRNVTKIVNLSDEVELLCYKYSNDDIQPAYNPFMEWVKQMYEKYYADEITIEEFVKESNVHALYSDVIISYMKTGICFSQEDMVVYDRVYNPGEFVRCIINLIEHVSEKIPLFIILDKFHFTNYSTVGLIRKMLNKGVSKHIAMLICFNDAYVPTPHIKNEWNNLLDEAETKNMLVDSGNSNDDSENSISNNEFIFNKDNSHEAVRLVNNMYYMFAFKQAEYYLDIIYQRIIFDKVYIVEQDKIAMVSLYVLVNISLGNVKYAMLLCDEIKTASRDNDLRNAYYYNYLSSLAQIRLNQREMANNHSINCLEIAEKMEDEYYIYKARTLYFLLESGFAIEKNLGLTPHSVKNNEIDSFMEEVLEHKMYCLACFLYVRLYERDQSTLTKADRGEAELTYFYKAVDIVKKIGNQELLERVYYEKYYMSNLANAFELESRLRNESIEIQNQMNYELTLFTYSLMGYNSIAREEFEKSHESNNILLKRMYDIHSMDNSSTGINNDILEFLRVLYNMATNCMCAGDFDSACSYLLVVAKEMEAMSIFEIFVCDMAKIYGMIAYCYYAKRMDYNAGTFLEKQKLSITHIIDENSNGKGRGDSMFFYYLVRALLKKNDGDYRTSEALFDIAYVWFSNETAQHFVIYPMLALGKYELYMCMGRTAEAENEIMECVNFCEEKSLHIRKKMLLRVLDEGIEKGFYDVKTNFKIKGISLAKVAILLKNRRIESDLMEKEKDGEFLLIWQDNLNNYTNESSTIICSAMSLLKKYFNLDNLFFIDAMTKKTQYEDGEERLSNSEINEIIESFSDKSKAFIVKRIERSFKSYEKLLKVFGLDKIVTLIGVPVIRDAKVVKIFVAYTTLKEEVICNSSIVKDYKIDTIKLAVNQLVNAEKINNTVEIANSANKAKSAFLANISHEIRTPITAVLGMDEMILRECESEQIAEYAINIQNAGKTLLSIINDVLDFSKIESGKMEIIPARYDMSQLLSSISNMISKKAEDKNLEFKMQVASETPNILFGDEVRIKQVILNVLSNAVKYTQNGGIAINIYSLSKAEYIKKAESYKNKRKTGMPKSSYTHVVGEIERNEIGDDALIIVFEISDTGIGIRKRDIENLFSSFTRIEEKRNRHIEGTGLGLSIVKQLILMMNGDLGVESQYGNGTIFRFAIPQEAMEGEIVGDFESRLKSSIRKRELYHETFIAPNARILFVDDNQMNLTVAKALLKKTLIKIDTAESGAECLKMIKDTKYDMIFMDHMMPEMDGIETLENIKKSKHLNTDTPVVALTANVILGAKSMYNELGFFDYMIKPIDSAKLEELISGTLDEKLVYRSGSREFSQYMDGDINLDAAKNEVDFGFKHINSDLGLRYCGNSENTYKIILTEYYTAGYETMNKLKEMCITEDMKGYKILIHSLKSTSLNIGSQELYDKSQLLEDAARDGKIEYVQKNNLVAMELYKIILEDIESYLERNALMKKRVEIVSITSKELIEKLNAIKNNVLNYLMLDAVEKIDELNNYDISSFDISNDINDVRKYIDDYDVDSASSVLDKIVKKISIL